MPTALVQPREQQPRLQSDDARPDLVRGRVRVKVRVRVRVRVRVSAKLSPHQGPDTYYHTTTRRTRCASKTAQSRP